MPAYWKGFTLITFTSANSSLLNTFTYSIYYSFQCSIFSFIIIRNLQCDFVNLVSPVNSLLATPHCSCEQQLSVACLFCLKIKSCPHLLQYTENIITHLVSIIPVDIKIHIHTGRLLLKHNNMCMSTNTQVNIMSHG